MPPARAHLYVSHLPGTAQLTGGRKQHLLYFLNLDQRFTLYILLVVVGGGGGGGLCFSLRQGVTVQHWLDWVLLCRSG